MHGQTQQCPGNMGQGRGGGHSTVRQRLALVLDRPSHSQCGNVLPVSWGSCRSCSGRGNRHRPQGWYAERQREKRGKAESVHTATCYVWGLVRNSTFTRNPRPTDISGLSACPDNKRCCWPLTHLDFEYFIVGGRGSIVEGRVSHR